MKNYIHKHKLRSYKQRAWRMRGALELWTECRQGSTFIIHSAFCQPHFLLESIFSDEPVTSQSSYFSALLP